MKMKTFAIFILCWLFFLSLTAPAVLAITRKILPGKTVSRSVGANTVGISVHLRRDRHAVIINLSHLNLAEAVSYTLTYMTNGKLEGSPGTIRLGGEIAASRELLFGTCSTSVCTYHTNITNARLEIRIKLKNGKTFIRRYSIKV